MIFSYVIKNMTFQLCDKPDLLEGERMVEDISDVFQKLNAIPRASTCAELSQNYHCTNRTWEISWFWFLASFFKKKNNLTYLVCFTL